MLCVPPKTVIWRKYKPYNMDRWILCEIHTGSMFVTCLASICCTTVAPEVFLQEKHLLFIPESSDRFVFCNFSAIVQRLSRNKKKSGVCFRRIECEKKEHLVSPRTTRKPFRSTGWTERAFYNQMCIIPQPAIHNITNTQCVHWRHRRVICAGLWRKSFHIRESLKNPGQWGMRYSHVSWTLNTSAQLKAAFSALLPCPLIIQ